jgi:preprotein translocase subunit SecE
MDEQEKQVVQQPEKKEKKDKRKSNTPGIVANLRSFLIDVRGELRKIVWPDRKELQKKTITVIITSLLFALIIFGFDSLYNFILQFSVRFLP